MQLLTPTNQQQLIRFLGIINYYWDEWQRRSHWGDEEQHASDEAKFIIS